MIPFDCVENYNYGASKGLTFENVVVIPVGTVIPFLNDVSKIEAGQTKSKFYVACTRAKYMIVFLIDHFVENRLFKRTTLELNETMIECYKYQMK